MSSGTLPALSTTVPTHVQLLAFSAFAWWYSLFLWSRLSLTNTTLTKQLSEKHFSPHIIIRRRYTHLACLGSLLPLQRFISAKEFSVTLKIQRKSDLNTLSNLSFTTCLTRSYNQQHPKQPIPSRKEVWVHMVFLTAAVKFLPTPSCILLTQNNLIPICASKFLSLKDLLGGKQHGQVKSRGIHKPKPGAVPSCGCPRSPSCFISLCLSFSTHGGNDTSLAVKENTI